MSLPTTIEASLVEIGYSRTDLLVLKHLLLSNEEMTLRQIASKTGRSTGVLDASVRKLMSKGVVKRVEVNGSSQYVIENFSEVIHNYQQTMEETMNSFAQKLKDLESFGNTIVQYKKQPRLIRYTGAQGYEHFLSKVKNSPIRVLAPACETEAQIDFLTTFITKLSKAAHGSEEKICVIGPDSIWTKRLRESDYIANRETRLLKEPLLGDVCKVIIAGRCTAYLDQATELCTVIDSCMCANTDHANFELLWSHAK